MSTSDRDHAIEAYGWTSVPASLSSLLQESTTPSSSSSPKATPYPLTSLPYPTTPLVQSITSYAREHLPTETFNHSMRVYRYGVAILLSTYPSWTSITAESTFLETYALSALLHDIGTTDTNLNATLMSFEFYGGFIASEVLGKEGAVREQRDLVVEAVVRHQDLGEVGKQTRIGGLLQLATIFDNMGLNPYLVHKETIENVVKEYPRLGWSKCFAHTIRKENSLKPWAHTTHLGENDFPEGVEGNKLMAEYD